LTLAKNFSAPQKAHQTVYFARVFLLLTSYFPFCRPRGTRKYQWSLVKGGGARGPQLAHQLGYNSCWIYPVGNVEPAMVYN